MEQHKQQTTKIFLAAVTSELGEFTYTNLQSVIHNYSQTD